MGMQKGLENTEFDVATSWATGFNKILLQRLPEIQVYLKPGFSLSPSYRLKNQLLEGLSCLLLGKKG